MADVRCRAALGPERAWSVGVVGLCGYPAGVSERLCPRCGNPVPPTPKGGRPRIYCNKTCTNMASRERAAARVDILASMDNAVAGVVSFLLDYGARLGPRIERNHEVDVELIARRVVADAMAALDLRAGLLPRLHQSTEPLPRDDPADPQDRVNLQLV